MQHHFYLSLRTAFRMQTLVTFSILFAISVCCYLPLILLLFLLFYFYSFSHGFRQILCGGNLRVFFLSFFFCISFEKASLRFLLEIFQRFIFVFVALIEQSENASKCISINIFSLLYIYMHAFIHAIDRTL